MIGVASSMPVRQENCEQIVPLSRLFPSRLYLAHTCHTQTPPLTTLVFSNSTQLSPLPHTTHSQTLKTISFITVQKAHIIKCACAARRHRPAPHTASYQERHRAPAPTHPSRHPSCLARPASYQTARAGMHHSLDWPPALARAPRFRAEQHRLA